MKPGVQFVRAAIQTIDPIAKRVETDAGTFEGDILVIGLGADLDPGATPGSRAVTSSTPRPACSRRRATCSPTSTAAGSSSASPVHRSSARRAQTAASMMHDLLGDQGGARPVRHHPGDAVAGPDPAVTRRVASPRDARVRRAWDHVDARARPPASAGLDPGEAGRDPDRRHRGCPTTSSSASRCTSRRRSSWIVGSHRA